mgnify:CR=1 FL=1
MKVFIRIFSIIFILSIFSSYNPNKDDFKTSLLFPINKILIENAVIIDKNKLINSLNTLKGNSLFTVNKIKVKKITDKFQFISGVSVKKIYPDTIKIKIIEKKIIAINSGNKGKFYLTNKGDSIKYSYLEYYNNLPEVIGKSKNFSSFYKNLLKINFPTDQVKSYYYYEIGRWDIILKNDITIKLPTKNYNESLKNFINIINNKAFAKYKIFDYRILDQLVLN